MTPGVDNVTADASSLKLIGDIRDEINTNAFRFKPIRRFYVDKTGKNRDVNTIIEDMHLRKIAITKEKIKELKARPLGIPSFKDKIMQEAIRMVLNAIYEVEFAKTNRNFGFRPKYGTHDAILNIQTYSKSMRFAIEADIQGAFDNVEFDVLIDILRKKIKDERFLNIILQGLKCGINFANNIEQSKIGTTQGSVASPILYNIYFHEFDKFINTEFTELVRNINKKEKRTDRPAHKLYNSISKKKFTLKIKEKKDKLLQLFKDFGKEAAQFKAFHKKFKEDNQKYVALDRQQKKFPAFSKRRQTIRFHYVRYADDWLFLSNADLSKASYFKEIFTNWISDKLKLTLSPEKTLITDLSKKTNKIHFLGFQLSYMGKKAVRTIGKKISFYTNIVDRTKNVQ